MRTGWEVMSGGHRPITDNMQTGCTGAPVGACEAGEAPSQWLALTMLSPHPALSFTVY